MTNIDHDRWSDDLAAYLIGALEPAEAAELERHTEGCERCRSEMRWLTPAVQALPEAAVRREPPRELRSRLMAEVRADAGERVRPDGSRYGAPDPSPLQRASHWLRGLGSGPMGLRPIAGVAASLLVVAVVAGFAIAGGIGSGESGSSTITHGHAPGITAEVVRRGNGGTLHLANVRPLPHERVLEAWVRRDGEVEPVPALFVPDREGHASTTIADMRGVNRVMVTTEPPEGSRSPTSSPIVSIPIPAS